jgi:hypothetical protein
MSEITSENVDLSSPADLVRKLAEPVRAGESIKALILRAWRHARDTARQQCVEEMSARRIRAIWYSEARGVLAYEIDLLRAAVRGKDVTSKTEIWEYARGLERRLEQLETQLKRAREHS